MVFRREGGEMTDDGTIRRSVKKRATAKSEPEVIDLVDDSDEDEQKEPIVIDLVHDEPPKKKKKTSSSLQCDVVILVDDREPIHFLNRLKEAGVPCEGED